jgi:hypothetical protein
MIPKEQVLEKIWPMGRDKEVTPAVQLIEGLVGDDGACLRFSPFTFQVTVGKGRPVTPHRRRKLTLPTCTAHLNEAKLGMSWNWF